MKKHFTSIKVGILGGGQLARMMILSGHKLGVEMHVLSKDPTDPAAQVTRHWHKGDPNDSKSLTEFFKHVDIVTFESEFLDADKVSDASRNTSTPVQPLPKIMGALQDRHTQKLTLVKYGLPTSSFTVVSSSEEAAQAWPQFTTGMVLKQRRFGYDGYGTIIIKRPEDIQIYSAAIDKCPYGYVAEAFVPFKRELAISLARNKSGEVSVFPLVESLQVNARCFWVKGPVKNSRLKTLLGPAKKMLHGLNYQGVLTIELFDTGSRLLVNELAPRVHNSAHYSQDALDEDQFTAHLKGILNATLK